MQEIEGNVPKHALFKLSMVLARAQVGLVLRKIKSGLNLALFSRSILALLFFFFLVTCSASMGKMK